MLNHKSTREQKIEWLLKNQHMWEGLKLPEEKNRLRNVAERMQEEGLYSKKTFILDICHSVNNIIHVARKERRNASKRTNR